MKSLYRDFAVFAGIIKPDDETTPIDTLRDLALAQKIDCSPEELERLDLLDKQLKEASPQLEQVYPFMFFPKT